MKIIYACICIYKIYTFTVDVTLNTFASKFLLDMIKKLKRGLNMRKRSSHTMRILTCIGNNSLICFVPPSHRNASFGMPSEQ